MPIFLKLYRCFCHGLKMCMRFGYNPQIIFCHFYFFLHFELGHFSGANTINRYRQWVPCMRNSSYSFCRSLPELFCLLLGPPGFNCWFSFAPVFQWCSSTPQGSPGVGRNTFLSSPHLCFIIVFICDLFVSRDDPLMS